MIEPYNTKAIQRILLDGYEQGFFSAEETFNTDPEFLKAVYKQIQNFPFTVQMYNRYFQQEVKILN